MTVPSLAELDRRYDGPQPADQLRQATTGKSALDLQAAKARAAIAHLEAGLRDHSAMSTNDRASYERQLRDWRAFQNAVAAAQLAQQQAAE